MEGRGILQIRSAPSAVVALDVEGRISILNAHAEALLSTTAEQASGRTYEEVFGPSLASRVVSLFLHTTRTGTSAVPKLVKTSLPNGRLASLRASVGPIRDSAGALVGLLFVADEATGEQSSGDGESQSQLTERLRVALRRYLGPDIATMIEARPSFVGLGGVRRHVSVLHADIRGYTTVAEALAPEEVVELLLSYHGAAVDALKEAGATLDRFIGDSVLAIWNAPNPCEGHARCAIDAAFALQRAVQAVGADLAYGIGLHTGDAIVGNVGNESYLNYTAVGDTVNVAARLQAQAAAGEIVCSAATLAEAGEVAGAAGLGPLDLKGRKNPIEAFRLTQSLMGGH